MASLALLLTCLFLGVTLRRWLPESAPLVLNRVLVGVFIPALTLLYVAELHFDSRLLLPVLAPYLVFGGGCAFIWTIGSRLSFDRATLGALLLTGGISSISFVGFPIFEWVYGRPGLEAGILMSQAGTFVICVTFGVGLASWLAAEEPSVGKMLRDMVRFPPFLAFVVALLANVLGYVHPPVVRDLLTKLSSPFTVIALLSVGMQIRFRVPKQNKNALLLGLGYKLLLAPLLVFVVYKLTLSQHGWLPDLCVLGSALGPMNTAAVLATQYNLNPSLAAQMVGLGIPLSFFGIYLIYNML
ncbi:AEC family transporter [Fibrella aquatilis]|uniref:Transporter n=1 Tax=Fibrella aquatilis TaxID=2817059 RepID=A0A939JUU5_9BACT|nr:AEC family transporter [Fibrella aquatilis]MBO0930157.1 transporter [Fibrella aquatilis]